MTPPNTPREGAPLSLDVTHSLSGRFTLAVGRGEGRPGEVLADFKNTILNQGLDFLLANSNTNLSPWRFAQVGASSSPEDPGQTALLSRIAHTEAEGSVTARNSFSSINIIPGEAYEIRCSKTIRFPAGAAAGNIAEVAIGWGAGVNDIFSRALVRDSNGDPSTVPVGADEFLDVTYTLSIFLDVTDKPFTLNLPEGTHEGVLRPAWLTGQRVPVNFFLTHGLNLGEVDTNLAVASNGTVGPLTGGVTGARQNAATSVSPQAYAPGSFYRDVLCSLGLSEGNITGGLGAWEFGFRRWHWYQTDFTPGVPKTVDKVFSIRLRIALGRA